MTENVPNPPYLHRPVRFIDTEFLGFDLRQPIVELAILAEAHESPSTLLNVKIAPPPPERPPGQEHLPTYRLEDADPEALQFSGYMPDGMVSPAWDGALELIHYAPRIFAALTDARVVGHTTWTDAERLRYWLRAYGFDLPRRFAAPTFDVVTLAEEHMPYLRSMRLTSIAEALGISTEEAHTARGDAVMTRRIYQRLRLCSDLDRSIIATRYAARD